jgi:small-conductance mechanosensitive channel
MVPYLTNFGLEISILHVIQLTLAVVAWFVGGSLSRYIWEKIIRKRFKEKSFREYVKPLVTYGLFILVFLFLSLTFYQYSKQLKLFNIISQISLFMLVGHYIYLFSKSRVLHVLTVIGLSSVSYFNHLALLIPSLSYINTYSLTVGSYQITPWSFLKTLVSLLIFISIPSLINQHVKRRIKKIKQLKTSTKEIVSKSLEITVYFVAGLVILNVLGINLSSLTFIGGALGVGIGFGLQKITSNFISGLILLFEQAIEIDDLIEMDGGIYGFVRKLGSRYTLIETFDGKEILVPNEDFVTNRVTNWTFSNNAGRIEINVGVSYKSDIKKAQSLMLEAAKEYDKCLESPEPRCFLSEFADSSVNFRLFFFIKDVTIGWHEPKSDVMMTIWEKFKENDIEIPFPQRDVNITSR